MKNRIKYVLKYMTTISGVLLLLMFGVGCNNEELSPVSFEQEFQPANATDHTTHKTKQNKDVLVLVEDIVFVDNLINYVLVTIEGLNKGHFKSPLYSLDISITGLNDGPHEHGAQVVPLRDTEILASDEGITLVSINWETDSETTHAPEDYTVCIQSLYKGNPIGDLSCKHFCIGC